MADLTVNSLSITSNTTLPLEASVGIFASPEFDTGLEVFFSTDACFVCTGDEANFTGGDLTVIHDYN